MSPTARSFHLFLLFLATSSSMILLGCTSDQARKAANQAPPIQALKSQTPHAIWDFEDIASGGLPDGWKVEATNQKGPLASWQAVTDATAPSGKQVLALTRIDHPFGGTFNLCWTDEVPFLDGRVSVRFKAVKGEEDQGGGVIWRARDRENYYIARFNPLENNFRIYYVRDGARKTLASTRVSLPAGQWHTLEILQQGNHFEGYLNGEKLLEGSNDLFTAPGGVGLWTKADAVTSFDDFSVSPLGEDSTR